MEVIRKIIIPVLVLVGVIIVGAYTYKKEEGFYATTIVWGTPSTSNATTSNATTSNVSTSNACGSNASSSSTYNILSNILSKYGDKIADSTVAELTLDVNYDGREKCLPDDISDEHKKAHDLLADAISKRNITEKIHHELLENMGRTTGNQMYYDDDEDCAEDSPSTMQGKEHSKACNKKPIDMNEYIRKDSIPCWGCSIE